MSDITIPSIPDEARATHLEARYLVDGFYVTSYTDEWGTSIVRIDTTGYGADLQILVNNEVVYEGYPDAEAGK